MVTTMALARNLGRKVNEVQATDSTLHDYSEYLNEDPSRFVDYVYRVCSIKKHLPRRLHHEQYGISPENIQGLAVHLAVAEMIFEDSLERIAEKHGMASREV